MWLPGTIHRQISIFRFRNSRFVSLPRPHGMMISRTARVWVTGHRGLVGSAVVRRLESAGFGNILAALRGELDLRDQQAVRRWVRDHEPEFVIHVAGKVGGILANSQHPADFL